MTDNGTLFSHTQFDWTYDAAGRLTDEVFTDVGNLLADVDDYKASYTYDLTGNRHQKSVINDTNHDGIFNAAVDRDEVTTYTNDANDRMLSESTVVDGAATESTAYGYTGTQQTSKTVVSQILNTQISNQTFTYDLQGRMYRATTETFNAGTLTSRNRATYQYGTDGIRYRAISETDTVLSLNAENWQLTTDTKYLIDANNHTGYQQVLQETVTDGNSNLVKKIVYTIGLDHISQTTFTPGGPAQGTTAVFHMDGHGSTRILTDLAGAILNIAGFAQIFHYTAYGEAINFQMGNAATQYLYSGEQFDSRIGQQYLRARYYDSATGTFNRPDPFFGNQSDPQSFHKYRYTSGDPIQFADPTGQFEGLTGLVGNMGTMVRVAASNIGAVGGAAARIAVTFGRAAVSILGRAGSGLWSAGYRMLWPSLNHIVRAWMTPSFWNIFNAFSTVAVRSALATGINWGMDDIVSNQVVPVSNELAVLANEVRTIPGPQASAFALKIDNVVRRIDEVALDMEESGTSRVLLGQLGLAFGAISGAYSFSKYLSMVTQIQELLANGQTLREFFDALPNGVAPAVKVAVGIDANTHIAFELDPSVLITNQVFGGGNGFHHNLHLMTKAVRYAKQGNVADTILFTKMFISRLDDFGTLEVAPRPAWMKDL